MIGNFILCGRNFVSPTPNIRLGTNKADQIQGTLGSDFIYAKNGNDQVMGQMGDDIIYRQNEDDDVLSRWKWVR
jgi:Ca2+-binding RTX toxin-like protein